MRIIAFITEAVIVRTILEHIGEPTTPPRIASAKSPPAWYDDSGNGDGSLSIEEETVSGDLLAQPEPEYEFDPKPPGWPPSTPLISAQRGLIRWV